MKIFWAFDALEDGLRTNGLVGETLAFLNEKLKAEIHPVYVLGSELLSSNPSFVQDTFEGMTKLTENKVNSILATVKIRNIYPSQVLMAPSYSQSEVVRNFIDYAKKHGADLIAVGSHSRSGVNRAVLGSFAETLLLESDLPVLVVGQNFDHSTKLNEILFPTDFSDDSAFAFNKALDLAKTLNAKITLFHHLAPLVDPIIQSAIAPFGGVWVSYRGEMDALKNKKKKLFDEWGAKAKSKGVEFKTYLDTETSTTAEAILGYAKDNQIGLIALGAQSGSLSATLFGAISRKVVRSSQCPVWILRKV